MCVKNKLFGSVKKPHELMSQTNTSKGKVVPVLN
jgi:hypothetical protein